MRFAYPALAILLLLVPAGALFFAYVSRRRVRLLAEFGEPELTGRLSDPKLGKVRVQKTTLLLAGMFFILFAFAGPQIGTKLSQITRHGLDVMIAIDCSRSMLAEDIAPDRMEKAKRELTSLIDKLQGDRVGVIAFAGDAFLQCPLTLDYSAAKMFLGIINTDLIPKPGTAIGRAIQLALKSFSQKERKYKVLVLLTDGEDHDSDPASAADEAKKEGVRIYTIGFGNPQGELIPLKDANGNTSGYIKDSKGEPVLSKLDDMLLQKISLVTGGKYYPSTNGEIELDRILDDMSGMDKKNLQSRLMNLYEDRFQYFLAIGLMLLLLEFLLPETGMREDMGNAIKQWTMRKIFKKQ